MRILRLAVFFPICLLLVKVGAAALPSGLTAVSGQVNADGGVNVIAKLGPDLAPNIASAKMQYRNWANGSPVQDAYTPVLPNIDVQGSSVTFAIAPGAFTSADQVEYYVEIDDASGKSLAQSFHYQLSFLQQRSLAQCVAQSAGKDAQIAGLNAQINVLKATILPKSIGADGNGIVSSESATFHLTTNTWGKIRVEARRADNPPVSDAIYTSPAPAKDHPVLLTGLTPGKTYKLVGFILNHLQGDTYDSTNPFSLGDQYSQLTFTTLKATPTPMLTVSDPAATTNSIVITTASVDDGIVTVLLEVLSDPLRDEWKKVDSRGSVKIDQYNIVTSDSKESAPYSFTSLTPGTHYKVTVNAVNQYGIKANPYVHTMDTKPLPPTFAFTGDVQLSMGVSGFTASWTATSKPSEGSFQVDYGDGNPVVSQPATIKDNTLTASLDVAGLTQVIQKSQSKGSQPSRSPTLRFMMKNNPNGTAQEESFVVNYVVPNQTQVKQATDKNVITKQQSQSIQNVLNGAANPSNKNKFSWSDLLATGLGVVLKLL